MKETLIRSLTGIVFTALIILCLVLHPLAYLALFSITITMAWLELARLFPERLSTFIRISLGALISCSFILFYFVSAVNLSQVWLLIPPSTLMLLLFADWMREPSGADKRILLLTVLPGGSCLHFIFCGVMTPWPM